MEGEGGRDDDATTAQKKKRGKLEAFPGSAREKTSNPESLFV